MNSRINDLSYQVGFLGSLRARISGATRQSPKLPSLAGGLLTVVVVVNIELGRRAGETIPIPFMLLFATVVLVSNMGGLRAGIISGVVAAGFILYSALVSFGPFTLTATGIPQVALGVLVVFIAAILLGRNKDRSEELARALNDSGARTRAILDTAPDAIITIDEKGIVESINTAAEGIFGYTAGEVVGQNVSILMPSPYREEHDNHMARYLATGESRVIGIGREVVGLRKDGTTFPMYISVSEVPLDGRRMFTGIVGDITERKQVEGALKTLNETLEKQVAERTAVAEERARELEVLHRIDQSILVNPELEAVAQVIVQLIAELTGAQRCLFDLPDSDRILVRNLAAYGYAPYQLEVLRSNERRIGEGLSGWVIMTGQPGTSNDMLRDPRFFRLLDYIRAQGDASGISVPVISQGRVIGALTEFFNTPQEFSQEHIQQLVRLGTQIALAFQNAQHLSQIHSFTMETIIALAEAIEHRDPYTGGHCRRLGIYARTLAKAMGLTPSEQEAVHYGAILHDIGKIAVRETVLLKPGSLDPEEWVQIKQHPFIGSQIAKKVSFLQPMAPLIYHHHERYDGTGYLDGLSGESIPLGARIIAVVDAYDAMTTDRPYRRAMSQKQAMDEIRAGSGTQFDPDVVATFIRISGELDGSNIPDYAAG